MNFEMADYGHVPLMSKDESKLAKSLKTVSVLCRL